MRLHVLINGKWIIGSLDGGDSGDVIGTTDIEEGVYELKRVEP